MQRDARVRIILLMLLQKWVTEGRGRCIFLLLARIDVHATKVMVLVVKVQRLNDSALASH